MYGPIKLFHIQNICSWILVLAAAFPAILGSGDSCVCRGQSWQKSPNTTTIRIHCAESHSCWVPRKQTLSGGFDCTSAIGTWLGASLWSYPQEVCPLFRFFLNGMKHFHDLACWKVYYTLPSFSLRFRCPSSAGSPKGQRALKWKRFWRWRKLLESLVGPMNPQKILGFKNCQP